MGGFLAMMTAWQRSWDTSFLTVGPLEDPPLPDVIAPTRVSGNEIGLPLKSAQSAGPAWNLLWVFVGRPRSIPDGLPFDKNIGAVKGLLQSLLTSADNKIAAMSAHASVAPRRGPWGWIAGGAIVVGMGLAAARHR